MKKYKGLLVLLVLATIIGGVYAVWTYAGTKAENATGDLSIGLESKQITGTYGNITVTVPDNFVISLDQDTGNTEDKWHAIAKVSGGDITVTFTPATAEQGAPEWVTESGIKMQWKIEGPEDLMNVDETPAPVFVDGEGDTGTHSVNITPTEIATTALSKNEETGTFSFTIKASDIEALIIDDNINLHLPTPEKYDAFLTNLSGKVFTLTVEDIEVAHDTSTPPSNPTEP